ncbi:hypothetical protein M422DRAFT_261043 [Sphaerobolus stellatus SS14]|uniref:Glycoside hydrolase family 43 protein n=1 Tax=Sphaerobolus stellatus (strain SS14) TaxID=990650 RepID=A0A0C9U155_SPHS4|nr:hypothetical protein M422DRAFT_261043 [Sphaerobolus stellatus SS14]
MLPKLAFLSLVFSHLYPTVLSQSRTPTLGIADGLISLDTPSFSVQLVKDSQTLASLKPKGSAAQTNNGTFDFAPFDQLANRQFNGNYQLGDITFRARIAGSSGAFINGDTSAARRPVTAVTASGSTLAAANLSATLPATSLLNIVRRWTLQNQTLGLEFDVSNHQTQAVEIGSIGFPIVFNTIFTGRTSTDTNFNCSLIDPYIGADAGFVQVMPLLGTLPPLIITPLSKSPFEAWRFLPESTANTPFYQSQTFEGYYEWQTHTLAWAQNEWKNVTPWNVPTSEVLQPGQTRTFGLQFHLGTTIRDIDTTLANAGQPTTFGVPGYILAADQMGKLFINYSSPVQALSVSPTNALTLTRNTEGKNGFTGFTVTVPSSEQALPARVRVTITYADGKNQTVHYFVIKPATQTISDLGNFLLQNQWFVNSTDPFHRSPSIISYDRDVNAFVTNDDRAWIPGLSDEAGAGSWLAAGMKQFAQPNAAEVTKFEQFINQTLWGSVQLSNGTSVFGVRKSVYFYQPALVPGYNYDTADYNFGGSWNQNASFLLNRAYDYVHVTAAYWAMYRVARNYPALVTRPWQWYINQALQTVLFVTNSRNGVGFADDGLMGETVWRFLLDDLQREGLTTNATALQSAMQARERNWSGERFPFGSEMAWDSTGQEGVYMWAQFFNDTATRVNALNSILAYQPTIPHWGWNGNARRYWDNLYGGKLRRIERQIHHYGSGLNALPLISEFESNPTDWYLLRTGYGGLSGPLSNIDTGGFAAASFHSWPDTLKFDGYSGDYGPNFVGHTLNARTIIINHPNFGWQAFGGMVSSSTTTSATIQIQDSLRRRIFIAPFGLLLSLDAGAFSSAVVDTQAKTVSVTILPAAPGAVNAAKAPQGRLVVTKTASVAGIGNFTPMTSLNVDAGAFVVPFQSGAATVSLASA